MPGTIGLLSSKNVSFCIYDLFKRSRNECLPENFVINLFLRRNGSSLFDFFLHPVLQKKRGKAKYLVKRSIFQ